MPTLAEIREKLRQSEIKSENNFGDNAIYPFWNLKENGEAIIRFLPDGDPDNTFFWKEKAEIRLPFSGIKGDPSAHDVIVKVPCMETWGATCPILSEVRTWFKDPSLEEMGRKYWKKRSYLFQGFVVEDGIGETDTPENPIRRFIITPQIYQIIKNSLVDPDLDEIPTDFVHGLDFRIRQTKNGNYKVYTGSTWARKERPLSDLELEAVKQYGLSNLSDFLPKKPSDIELNIIKEMFTASVDGEAYDPDLWGKYYKPTGNNKFADTESRKPSTPAVDPDQDDPDSTAESEPTPAPVTGTGDDRAKAILEMIRSRQKAA